MNFQVLSFPDTKIPNISLKNAFAIATMSLPIRFAVHYLLPSIESSLSTMNPKLNSQQCDKCPTVPFLGWTLKEWIILGL
jgi:hypothetical protein